MPVLIPPGFVEIAVNFHCEAGTHPGTSLFGASVDSPPTTVEVGTLSSALAEAYRDVLSTESTYDGVRVLIGQDGGDPLVIESFAGAHSGDRGGALGPPQVQGLIKKSSEFSGRHNIGRTFVPDVLKEDANSIGQISSGYATVLNNFAAAISSAITDGPFTGMVILHSTNLDPTPVTAYAPEAKVATLRKRFER